MLDGGTGAIILFSLTIAAGLCTMIALCRAGIQIFWADTDWLFSRVRISETVAVIALLSICMAFTFVVAAPWAYVSAAAQQVHTPGRYIQAVLPAATEAAP